jgi:hypothetical protein
MGKKTSIKPLKTAHSTTSGLMASQERAIPALLDSRTRVAALTGRKRFAGMDHRPLHLLHLRRITNPSRPNTSGFATAALQAF